MGWEKAVNRRRRVTRQESLRWWKTRMMAGMYSKFEWFLNCALLAIGIVALMTPPFIVHWLGAPGWGVGLTVAAVIAFAIVYSIVVSGKPVKALLSYRLFYWFMERPFMVRLKAIESEYRATSRVGLSAENAEADR